MLPTSTSFAPGKLILTGEHAVVHGFKAVALATQRGCTVSLRMRNGPSGVDNAPADDERLRQAVASVLPAEGIGVDIESDIPIGRGMGSSAAMTIALIRAKAHFDDEKLNFHELHRRGFALERIFHGNPSGIDHAVSALGGMLEYQRSENGPTMKPITAELPPIVVIDSGFAGNTAQQVQKVEQLGAKGRSICTDIHHITTEIIRLFPTPDPDTIGTLLTENHQQLVALGVSTPELNEIVQLALQAGAHGAKLAGAGGGGIVMALASEPQSVLDAATDAGYTAFQTRLHPPLMRIP